MVIGVVKIGFDVDEIESLVSRPSGTIYNKNVNYSSTYLEKLLKIGSVSVRDLIKIQVGWLTPTPPTVPDLEPQVT